MEVLSYDASHTGQCLSRKRAALLQSVDLLLGMLQQPVVIAQVLHFSMLHFI